MELLSFFRRFVEKVIISCFSDSMFEKRRNNQMAAVMLQMISAFKQILRKTATLF